MKDYEPASSFGDDIADDYDELARRGDEAETVAFLARLAGDGPALELAVGTGRIALPLSARGLRVDGITFFNLLTQDDQVRCFENVAAHLTDDGSFVVEAFVPAFLYRLRDDQYVDAEAIEVDEVRLDVGRHDPVQQRLDESHVSLSHRGVRVNPVVTRYAWPSELDLMARIAGLRLAGRWAGWSGEPFTAASGRHVSVYTP